MSIEVPEIDIVPESFIDEMADTVIDAMIPQIAAIEHAAEVLEGGDPKEMAFDALSLALQKVSLSNDVSPDARRAAEHVATTHEAWRRLSEQAVERGFSNLVETRPLEAEVPAAESARAALILKVELEDLAGILKRSTNGKPDSEERSRLN